MKQEIKDEVIEQLDADIQFGFENQEELFESIKDMFYDEEDFDEEWLKRIISEKYIKHQKDSLVWHKPTDFERLAKSFDELTKQRIICLHKAGITRQDAIGDCFEVINKLRKVEIDVVGYCYYHSQDLGRAIDPEVRNLFLGFGSVNENDEKALWVANKIVESLKKNDFEVNWTGTVDQRIEIKNINWKKVPDNENWGMERVVEILRIEQNKNKPFWKLW